MEGLPESANITDYTFTLLHLRSSGDTFDVVHQETLLYSDNAKVDQTTVSSNLRCSSHKLDRWKVFEGDQFGVVMIAQCYYRYCPIQVGLINTGCGDTSLFEPDYQSNVLESLRKPSIAKGDTTPVAIKVNIDVKVKSGELYTY